MAVLSNETGTGRFRNAAELQGAAYLGAQTPVPPSVGPYAAKLQGAAYLGAQTPVPPSVGPYLIGGIRDIIASLNEIEASLTQLDGGVSGPVAQYAECMSEMTKDAAQRLRDISSRLKAALGS